MMRTWLMILSGLCIQLTAASAASGQQLPLADRAAGASLSASLQAIQLDICRTLEYYYQRPLRVAEKTPWSVMHSLVAFGVDTELDAGNRHVNAIGWLCYNQPARGMRLFEIKRSLPAPRQGPGLEGHRGQLLSMLAQSRVRPEYAIKVSGHEFSVADLVRHEQLTCKTDQELTFKLIAWAPYPARTQPECERGCVWRISSPDGIELRSAEASAARRSARWRVEKGCTIPPAIPGLHIHFTEPGRKFQYQLVCRSRKFFGPAGAAANKWARARMAGIFTSGRSARRPPTASIGELPHERTLGRSSKAVANWAAWSCPARTGDFQ